MTTETLTLSQFLLERIAEDEAWGRDSTDEYLLATCKAHRAIVEDCRTVETLSDEGTNGIKLARFTLRALASVYADHPDFDPRWAL